jgi:hypothetical protein
MITLEEVVQNGYAWDTHAINTLNDTITRLQHECVESNAELEKYRKVLKENESLTLNVKVLLDKIEDFIDK